MVERIFLGYSISHKGYRCLAVDGKIYISKDVIFNEYKFPYTHLFPSEITSLPLPSTFTNRLVVLNINPPIIYELTIITPFVSSYSATNPIASPQSFLTKVVVSNSTTQLATFALVSVPIKPPNYVSELASLILPYFPSIESSTTSSVNSSSSEVPHLFYYSEKITTIL